MANLIPNVDPTTISLKPERDIAISLVRDLPDTCRILHSYSWLKPEKLTKTEALLEGEADFLILDPRFGLLVLEVKGGEIRHRIEKGKEVYYRKLSGGRSKVITHPFQQAKNNLHAIEKILNLKEQPNLFGGCYGYAVAFPDCVNQGQLPHNVDINMVFFADHLADMDRAVRGAFRAWNRLENPSLSADSMRRCQELLKPVFNLCTAKWRDLDKDNEELVRLTDQQKIVLEGLKENKRLSIKGGAGTGKTLLALWRVVEYAKEGHSVLFLCYNSSLAEWLNSRLEEELPGELRKLITIKTFHGLCNAFYKKAKTPFKPPANPQEAATFWQKEVPDKMFDKILDTVSEPRFDAIVVDEAQDFAPDWWLVIQSLAKDSDGPLSIFFDPNQNIFHQDAEWPVTNTTYTLSINCRNTRLIHQHSVRYLNADIAASPHVPEGLEPIVLKSNGEKEQRKQLDELLKEWRGEFKLEPNRIAILSSLSKRETCLSDSDRIGAMPIIEKTSDWRSGQGVLFSTVRAFKGLEADVIVVLPNPNSAFDTNSERYVATSRAKHLLAICELQQADQEGR